MKQFLEQLRSALDTKELDGFDKLMAIDCLVESKERETQINELAKSIEELAK